MKRFLFCVLLILILLLSSCRTEMSDFTAMGATAFFAVPSVGELDMRDVDDVSEEIEKDEYGRVLYLYRGYCGLAKEDKEILIIYQKHDDDYVYYYEDICYMFAAPSTENIESIKAINDWGCPLDESKMSRRRVRVSLWNRLNTTSSLTRWDVEQSISEEIGLDIHAIDIDDVSPIGQEAYFVILKNASGKLYYGYYAIVDSSYKAKIMRIDSFEDFLQKLRPFKQECGWYYGI